jgi:4-nitrophenyl phosphatase
MNVVCDLDGVVYRGERLLPGADRALAALAEQSIGVVFVTNNSTRTPDEVVGKIGRLTGLDYPAEAVVTSAAAAATMIGPRDEPAFVFGSGAIAMALDEAGVGVTADARSAQSVVVGLDRDLSYARLDEAANAVRSGARFIATNRDPTYPTEHGLAPGSGAVVAALETASGRTAEVAGKPNPPMRELIRSRGVGEAFVIGDRSDTDIALAAHEPDWRSILVLTGVTDGDPANMADHVCADLAEAVGLVLAATGRR